MVDGYRLSKDGKGMVSIDHLDNESTEPRAYHKELSTDKYTWFCAEDFDETGGVVMLLNEYANPRIWGGKLIPQDMAIVSDNHFAYDSLVNILNDVALHKPLEEGAYLIDGSPTFISSSMKYNIEQMHEEDKGMRREVAKAGKPKAFPGLWEFEVDKGKDVPYWETIYRLDWESKRFSISSDDSYNELGGTVRGYDDSYIWSIESLNADNEVLDTRSGLSSSMEDAYKAICKEIDMADPKDNRGVYRPLMDDEFTVGGTVGPDKDGWYTGSIVIDDSYDDSPAGFCPSCFFRYNPSVGFQLSLLSKSPELNAPWIFQENFDAIATKAKTTIEDKGNPDAAASLDSQIRGNGETNVGESVGQRKNDRTR